MRWRASTAMRRSVVGEIEFIKSFRSEIKSSVFSNFYFEFMRFYNFQSFQSLQTLSQLKRRIARESAVCFVWLVCAYSALSFHLIVWTLFVMLKITKFSTTAIRSPHFTNFTKKLRGAAVRLLKCCCGHRIKKKNSNFIAYRWVSGGLWVTFRSTNVWLSKRNTSRNWLDQLKSVDLHASDT